MSCPAPKHGRADQINYALQLQYSWKSTVFLYIIQLGTRRRENVRTLMCVPRFARSRMLLVRYDLAKVTVSMILSS